MIIFLWITLPLAKQIQFVSLKKILPFPNYRERRTFFRIFFGVKHSSLPRQTVAFFNWTGHVWSVNMSSFDNSACVFLVMKHRLWKLLCQCFMFRQWMSTANCGFIFLVNADWDSDLRWLIFGLLVKRDSLSTQTWMFCSIVRKRVKK